MQLQNGLHYNHIYIMFSRILISYFLFSPALLSSNFVASCRIMLANISVFRFGRISTFSFTIFTELLTDRVFVHAETMWGHVMKTHSIHSVLALSAEFRLHRHSPPPPNNNMNAFSTHTLPRLDIERINQTNVSLDFELTR